MIEVGLAQNLDITKKIALEVWDLFAEDGTDPSQVPFEQGGGGLWLHVYEGPYTIGICKVCILQRDTVSVHPYLLKEHSRKYRAAVKKIAETLFFTYGYNKIQVFIGEQHKTVIKVAESVGCTREGVLRKSYFKNGKYWDQIVLGLLKDEFIRG
jgi:RimJ/RimL family protein N-acetyltransferase